jgi:hypothetical protein
VANETQGAHVVVIGTIRSIGLPQWNTSDGSAPPFTAQGHPPLWAQIYRPTKLSVESVSKGTAAGTVTVRLIGGAVGCYTYRVEGPASPIPGSRYAVFLGLSTVSGGFTDAELTVRDAWPIGADGTVATAQEGNMSIQSFTSKVKAAQPGP